MSAFVMAAPRAAGANASARRVLVALLVVALTFVLVGAARLVAETSVPATSPAAGETTLSAADWSQISTLLYAAQPTTHGATFANHGHRLTAEIAASGARIVTAVGSVSLGLAGLGRGLEVSEAVPFGAPVVSGASVELTHEALGVGITEWWLNDARGLEHGFTIDGRAPGQGDLALRLALGGSLVAELVAPDALAFAGSGLTYAGLKVWDVSGRPLDARFELDGQTLAIVVNDAGAHYPVTIDPTFAYTTYFKPANTGVADQFGVAVAIDRDTLVVGAPLEDSNATGIDGDDADNSASAAGAAYVFVRSAGIWTQQAYLKASNTDANDDFGTAVAIDGDTVVVGAPGEASTAPGVNGDQNDDSEPDAGAAYVFTRSGSTWTQQAYLKASNPDGGDLFGGSVAIDSDTVVVGAKWEDSGSIGVNGTPDESALESGAAYVFTRSNTTWTQQAYLKASNTGGSDSFGGAVDVSGDTLVVGAGGEDSNATLIGGDQANNGATAAGAVYVFSRTASTWSQQAYVKASNTDAIDNFGLAVALDGETLVVGAWQEDSSAVGVDGDGTDNSASGAGAAYIYTRSGTTWSHDAYLKASNTDADDGFGTSVDVDNDVVVVGAWHESSSATLVDGNEADNTFNDAGAVYVFMPDGAGWSQRAYLKASNTSGSDEFGDVVAVDGDTIAVGAHFEDSSATGINGSGTLNDSLNSGAAYAYEIAPALAPQAYLKASNTDANDWFGTSVAVSGDTVVVGAPGEQSTNGLESNDSGASVGAVYVFTRTGTTWAQQAYLKASERTTGDQFGEAVGISGDTIVVGAFGEDSSTTGVNSVPDNTAGQSGAAYVFTRSGTTWTEQAYLKASNTEANDNFGHSVGVSGDTIVVGAWQEDSDAIGVGGNQLSNAASNSGAAYVFNRSGTTWSQQAYLKASNTATDDHFGDAVAISGDTIVVGAKDEDSGNPNNQADNGAGGSGAAYVFTRSGNAWSQQAYLKAGNLGSGDGFGHSVGIIGNDIVVGAPFEDSSGAGVGSDGANDFLSDSGAAYIFHREGTTWTEVFEAFLKASEPGTVDQFGWSVSIGVDTVIVGARFEDSNATDINGDGEDNSTSNAGAAYLYSRTNGQWAFGDYIKASNTGTSDEFGKAVGVHGDTTVVGAPEEDSAATGVNGDGTDESATRAGAAYVAEEEGCIGPPFTDVAVDHPFCQEIRWMDINGISTGFDDGTYRPSLDVTRQAMSAFLARLSGATLTPCTTPPFSDVPIDHPFCEEIKWMDEEGISTGFDDGTYRPSIDVTRQAMSAFLARMADAELPTCTLAPFTDVATTHPFCEEIAWMKRTGISTGFSDGTYRPSIDVTRQAMSAFLNRASVFVR